MRATLALNGLSIFLDISLLWTLTHLTINKYMLKAAMEPLEKTCKICSKVTIKTAERRYWRRSGVFYVNFDHNSHLFLVFLLFTLNR